MNEIDLKELVANIVVASTLNVFSLITAIIDSIEEHKELSLEEKIKVFKMSLNSYVEKHSKGGIK